ncbi:MAG: (2Fe-2S)-binding protein [Candidatus Peregrinibacteria bacterium]|nr:(2Fe-2S)-binding protein [Candidatus Peregrinibacteria bacterium]
MNYELSVQQAETHMSDGFGKSKSADAKTLIKTWIKVRRDREIPEFDAIEEFKWSFEGEDNLRKYTEKLAEMLNENGGMFIEDALKLKEKDIFSMLNENIHPQDMFAIPALRAVKKAIVNYFENTKQKERLRKATETVICHCRHVTDLDIQEAIEKGHNTLESLSAVTGAGTGCNSCIGRVVEILNRKKTAFGGIK